MASSVKSLTRRSDGEELMMERENLVDECMVIMSGHQGIKEELQRRLEELQQRQEEAMVS